MKHKFIVHYYSNIVLFKTAHVQCDKI